MSGSLGTKSKIKLKKIINFINKIVLDILEICQVEWLTDPLVPPVPNIDLLGTRERLTNP